MSRCRGDCREVLEGDVEAFKVVRPRGGLEVFDGLRGRWFVDVDSGDKKVSLLGSLDGF